MKTEDEPEMREGLYSPERFRVKIVLRKDHFTYGLFDQERLAGDAELLSEWSSNKTKGF